MLDDLIIREATINDAEILFNLSNEETVRENSINRNKIEWNNHIKWLKEKIESSNYIIFLFFDASKFIGQVKFEIEDNEAVISISIAKEFRGKKLSLALLQKGISRFLLNNKNVEKIIAFIRPQNQASIKSFTKVGFVFSELVEINDDQFNKYLLLRESYE